MAYALLRQAASWLTGWWQYAKLAQSADGRRVSGGRLITAAWGQRSHSQHNHSVSNPFEDFVNREDIADLNALALVVRPMLTGARTWTFLPVIGEMPPKSRLKAARQTPRRFIWWHLKCVWLFMWCKYQEPDFTQCAWCLAHAQQGSVAR